MKDCCPVWSSLAGKGLDDLSWDNLSWDHFVKLDKKRGMHCIPRFLSFKPCASSAPNPDYGSL